MESSKELKFDNFSIKIQSSGFYEINIFKDGEFGIPQLKELVTAQEQLGSNKLPVLVLCDEFAYTETEFLKYLAKKENNPYSKADAFIINSIAQKILANFYIRIFVPERPTQFFKDREEAMKWLTQYI